MHRLVPPLLVALVLAGCSGGGDAPPDTVRMTDAQSFDPATLTVPPGTTVTFSNESAEAHTVTAYEGPGPDYFASGGFDSEEEARAELSDGLIAEDETYEVTFDEPGTYAYFCIPHEDQGMTGTVVVEE